MPNGDFYFAINATFTHFTKHWGEQALIAYWQAMGREYLAPLARRFQTEGPAGIARYWADYYAEETVGKVLVSQTDADTVLIQVRECPAIGWLQDSKWASVHPPAHPMYCHHCLYVNRAMLEHTDYEFELEGGGGSCRQSFRRRPSKTPGEVKS